ncbi:GTPase IMAP family member 4 [Patella vulgata]|uniref:GTPase IMAP family member 4 n=1 Tax=Patella vulgata TaxID=6465 RepID=UPI0021803FC9|nr:GTPase IMAP family member 4 [Patella vulgata]XP_050396839.1 GTPase IMAP family member 4 [Patella vulgata]
MAASSINNEIRMVMVGKTGVGKSALGNSLLRRHHFESSTIGMSVTSKCKFAQGNLRDGTKICIVDTPGIFDTRKSNEETTMEIVRCIGLSSPGPHTFLFVLSISRFTKEELDTVNHLVAVFGEDVINHVVIVFTGKESLTFEKLTLADYLKRVPPELSELVQRCRSRCVTINNRADDAEVQADVDGIINMVRRTIHENGGSYYTGEMYRAAEEALNEKMRLIDEEKHRRERELQKRHEELEQREREIEESASRRTQEHENEKRRLEAELQALRNSDTRQQVREEVESSPKDGILKTILKTVGTVLVGVLSGIATKRCTIS